MGRNSRDTPDEQVFSRMAEARERAGMTRQQLADQVGVHYQTVGYLERGEYNPSLALALRISLALSRPIDALFSLAPFDEDLEGGRDRERDGLR